MIYIIHEAWDDTDYFFSVQICLWLRQNQVSQECGMSDGTFFGLQVCWKKVNIYWSNFHWNKCFCILYFDIKCPELGNKWICLSDKVCICLLVCLWMFDVLNFFCITCQQLANPFFGLLSQFWKKQNFTIHLWKLKCLKIGLSEWFSLEKWE